ncbi:MAG: protein kinase, partial [Acidobacteria bacterium]|nr:protein kinase [Acidobacteriota bacterium]
MNSEEWKKVKNIFSETLKLTDADRSAFLEEACAGNRTILDEVKSLLAARNAKKNYFDTETLKRKPHFDNLKTDRVNDIFGRFRIVREIAQGGMGIVYLGERIDGEFTQKVAIKIIRRNLYDEEILKRFKRERQILANLDHPNIAKLLDGGLTDDGDPFFVMEYIEGEDLFEYLRNNLLTIEESLKLFHTICSAVAYAQHNLIVHRDLKPDNVLITKEGIPKLLDFGLAKILDENSAENTKTVNRAFTPAYASPEQFLGENMTAASDVYSLGVILYELLTGTKPFHFEGKTLDEIVNTIKNAEPLRPSLASGKQDNPLLPEFRGTKHLKGDLDIITLKALEKDVSQRYRSVEVFANDIDRLLNGMPISARPLTMSYRGIKFIKRNRIIVAAAALIFLSLITGLIFTLWQANEARRERDRAEKRFQEVRKLSNSLLFEISPKIESLAGSTEARELLIKRALEYLDSLANESQNDPGLQDELASAYEKIGDLQGNPSNPNLVDFEDAINSYEKALKIRKNGFDPMSKDANARRKLAKDYQNLGKIYGETNDYAGEKRFLLLGLEQIKELMRDDSGEIANALIFSEINYDLGLNQTAMSGYGTAIPFYDKAISILEDLRKKNGEKLEILRLLAVNYAQKSYSLSWESRQKEATSEMDKALGINARLQTIQKKNWDTVNTIWLVYWLAGNINEEVNDELFYEYQQKALDAARKASEKDNADIRAKQRLAKTLSPIGQAAINTGRRDQAVSYLKESLKIYEQIVESKTQNNRLKVELANSLVRLGVVLGQQGNRAEGISDLRKAVKIFEEIINLFPDDKRARNNLAGAYSEIAALYEK